MGRMVLIVALLVLIPLLGFTGFLYINQERLILPGKIFQVPMPTQAEQAYEPLSLTMPDGTNLHGILLPATTSPSTLILVFSGNMQDAAAFGAYLKKEMFPEAQYAIASLSYRGYPNGLGIPSEGKASQKTLYADAESIYDQLKRKLKPSKINVIGYSIGTAVSTHLATVRPVNRLLLLAPIASVRRMAQEKYRWLPVNFLLRNPFAVEDVFGKITIPTTILYSPTDGLVPTRHVTEVLHHANPAVRLIPMEGSNHTNLDIHPNFATKVRKALIE